MTATTRSAPPPTPLHNHIAPRLHPVLREAPGFDPNLVGKFWDEIQPGERMNDYPDKTIRLSREMVNQFADLTGDHNPLHVDVAFAMRSAYRRTISHGALLTALAVGQYHRSLYTYGTTLALITMNSSFFAPAYVGDEVYLEQCVRSKSTASHPKRGTVTYEAWIRRVPDHEPLLYIVFELLVMRKAGSKSLFRLGLTEEMLAKRTFRSDTDAPPIPGLKYPRHEDFSALNVRTDDADLSTK